MECGGVSFLLQIFPPKKRNICTAFYNFLCGIHQKRDSLVFYSCGKYRNSLMFSVLEPAPLSVWNLHHFPSGICIPFPLEPVSISLWNLLPSPLESASLSIQNLPRFPLESASLLSGICIALPLEPASLSVWNLHPFPLARPRPVCRPRPPRACCIFFAGFPLAQTTQRQKKKKTSLSLTGSKTALPVTQNLHPSLGFLFEDFAAAEFFWVDLRPFVSLARAACKVTKIRSYNNNLQDLQLLVSRVLIAQH